MLLNVGDSRISWTFSFNFYRHFNWTVSNQAVECDYNALALTVASQLNHYFIAEAPSNPLLTSPLKGNRRSQQHLLPTESNFYLCSYKQNKTKNSL